MNKDRVAGKIASFFLNVQKRFATFMNDKTAGRSMNTQKVSFIILCSIYISLSIWCIVDAFRKKTISSSVTVTHIRKIPLIHDKKESVNVVTTDVYKRLQQFRVYMDSLRECDSIHYDSILLARAGLLDTISVLEKIYLQQQK